MFYLFGNIIDYGIVAEFGKFLASSSATNGCIPKTASHSGVAAFFLNNFPPPHPSCPPPENVHQAGSAAQCWPPRAPAGGSGARCHRRSSGSHHTSGLASRTPASSLSAKHPTDRQKWVPIAYIFFTPTTGARKGTGCGSGSRTVPDPCARWPMAHRASTPFSGLSRPRHRRPKRRPR